MDMTRKANSGHPGGAFSSADFAAILFQKYLRYSPGQAHWPNRDRFVLSAGHESALQYALLNLAGLLPMQQLEQFRQLDSLTPGHPEVHLTPGVEATTGPLGQGVANAVGMALAESHLRARFGQETFAHHTYALVGDGDLQEDVALGACALAGHWGLDRLIVFYDKNDIQISGSTARASSTDFVGLFEAMQWRVISIDGNNPLAIMEAMDEARHPNGRPTLIIGTTVMAKGAHGMEGSHKAHGEPFSPDEILSTKEKLALKGTDFFTVSEETTAYFRERFDALEQEKNAWYANIEQRLATDATFRSEWESLMHPQIPESLELPAFEAGTTLATRAAFGLALEAAAKQLPGLMGGSADLEPSNNTGAFAKTVGEYSEANRSGRNLAFGVREFAMGAICNGLALHGGFIPFGATFLVFSDYMRNAIRMSALQELRVLHVFTHDSIYVGEDGPTHQPIEHTMSLRLIPGLHVMRPADALETVECLLLALRMAEAPTALLLTRQNLPVLKGEGIAPASGARKGAYVKFETEAGTPPGLLLLATGSEVHLAMDAARALAANGHAGNIRVVSMPDWRLFEQQPADYQNEVMAWGCTHRVSLEAGSTTGWQRWTGHNGLNIGIDRFGYSAPGPQVAARFGLNTEGVVGKIEGWLEGV